MTEKEQVPLKEQSSLPPAFAPPLPDQPLWALPYWSVPVPGTREPPTRELQTVEIWRQQSLQQLPVKWTGWRGHLLYKE